MYQTEVSNLSMNLGNARSGGKKIFTWTFTFKGGSEPINVNIHLLPNRNGKPARFRGNCEKMTEAIEHTDIQILHQKIYEELHYNCVEMSDIVWEDWYQIKTGGEQKDFKTDRHYEVWKSSINIEISRLKKGRINGEEVTLNSNGIVTPFPGGHSIKDDQEVINGFRIGRSNAEYSYVPATLENTAALSKIINGISRVRGKIAEFLSQDRAQLSLSSNIKLIE